MPIVQEYAKDFIIKELKAKLGTELEIEKLYFQPFNTLGLDSVKVYGQKNEKILFLDHISVDIDLASLINKEINITSAWLSDFEINLFKETKDSSLNIQYIIDAFKPKNEKVNSKVNFKLNTINIQNGNVNYDIKNQPLKEGVFDPNHIAISNLSTKLSLKSTTLDSLNIQVKKLAFKEKKGLDISNIICRVIKQKNLISIKGFTLAMPHSLLVLDKCDVKVLNINDSLSFIDRSMLECNIASSYISLKDIFTFIPQPLKNLKETIHLNGNVSGNINDFSISNFLLEYSDIVYLDANAQISDIRNKDNASILANINKLNFDAKNIQTLINNLSKKEVKLPSFIQNFGAISFDGKITGHLNNLIAHGSLNTELGSIHGDIQFNALGSEQIGKTILQGKIETSDYDVGKLFGNKDLDKISFNLNIDLDKLLYNKLGGKAEGLISNFDYKGYKYKGIQLDAGYDGMRVDGSLNLDDPNVKLNIDGLFDISDKNKPELKFNAKIKNVQLAELNIAKNYKHSYLSFIIDADFTGKSIDDIQGYIKIDSIDFIREDKNLQMKNLFIEATGLLSDRKLKISSDIINGEINGAYSFNTIINSIQQSLNQYLPALIKENKRLVQNENNMNFNFQINNTENLSSIFKLPFTIISPSKIIGFYNNKIDRFKLDVFTPHLNVSGTTIKSGHLSLNNSNNIINSTINAVIVGKQNSVNNVTVNCDLANNLLNGHVLFENNGINKTKGEFYISTLFSKSDKGILKTDIDILPSELLLNNNVWKLDRSNISISNNVYMINNFLAYNENGSQELRINGKYVSTDPHEILKAELKNINLEYIFQTLAIEVLKFGGNASGSLFLSSIEKRPYMNTRLEITDFKFNGTDLGKLKLFSELDEETNKVMLDGVIINKENKDTKVDGFIDPIKQKLSINFDADSIDISFLGAYTDALFQNVRGRGTGKVHLFGDFSNVTVEGKAFIKNGNVGVKFLNTDYSFTDTINLKKELIYFNNIIFKDQYNNEAIVSGKIAHDYFRNFIYFVNMSANNFLVYNVAKTQNPIFYGKVFGTGKGTIGGDESVVDIDMSMRTENKSIIRMNFMEDVVNEYSFITYKAPKDSDSTKIASNPMSPIKTDSNMDINMNFYIDATPDAVVELVMDPVGGDILKASGNGAMKFEWNTKSSPRLYGTYNINRGSYNFTFQRLLERQFTIQDGSYVQFRGDPFEANLDVKAIYKITANLYDLDTELTKISGQTTIPVNCILNLTGPLKHPNISLDIGFPSSVPEIERQVKNLINTEDAVNKQVASLLLLSKFYTPGDARAEHETSDFAAVASATLSNQLTKLISQIDSRWQLGTNIRYSDTKLTNTEIELNFSSRLLNDRLFINGSLGYRDNVIFNNDNMNTEVLIGDVDVEYLLNNAGNWRIKAFNHYNEKYYYTGNSAQTQGFGIIYKKDFDKLKDLFNKPILIQKKDTVLRLVPDSTKKGSSLSHFIKLKK